MYNIVAEPSPVIYEALGSIINTVKANKPKPQFSL